MQDYKREFIDFMAECQVLKFGDFVTKSGRNTPFFINTGFYRDGAQLARLGGYYAKAAIALSNEHGVRVRYCANRKEVKDHGDKGILLGSPLSDGDRVVIIEDVTTAGTSIEETMPIIRAQADVEVAGLLVSVDRMERGQGEKTALTEIAEKYGFRTAAIVTMADVIEHLHRPGDASALIDDACMERIRAYYEQYGAK